MGLLRNFVSASVTLIWKISPFRSGFRSACRSFNLPDLEVDCTGKVFLVTGATGTLGKVVAIQLAQKGGTVHIICRSKERADALRRSILDITENDVWVPVHFI